MNILYISCHSILEYDELRMFHDLGHTVYSIGGYINPRKPHVDIRPPLNFDVSEIHESAYRRMRSVLHKNPITTDYTSEFLDLFDAIVVMHLPDVIKKNWRLFKGRKVIWRTIGQSNPDIENHMKSFVSEGLQVVRYSPMERFLENYCGELATIRFIKYPVDYISWEGSNLTASTFVQSLGDRKDACNASVIESIASNVDFSLYGLNNSGYSFWKGYLRPEEQFKVLSKSRAYFYTGTHPAQYTLNFIEAMLAGTPIVSIGCGLAHIPSKFPFEVPDILNRIDSLYSDDLEDLKKMIHRLLNDFDYAKMVSDKQKIIANDLFSFEKNGYLWDNVLNSLK